MPWSAKQQYSRRLPLPDIEHQLMVDDIWSWIFGNISGDWSQASIKKAMAAFIDRYIRDIPATSSGTVTTYFIDRATR